MIDEDFKVFLIEVNTNPCLELSSNLLARLIPNMIENVFRLKNLLRIAIDPIFPPPDESKWVGVKKENISENLD
jgi:tubulin monoglycylase TTLL3/8